MILVALVCVVAWLTRRTTPEPDARVFCHRCDARFSDQRGLGWHISASHPQDFEVTEARKL
jgi:hypothetical protein